MLINKSEMIQKISGDKLVIGYDLGNLYSQISYCWLSNDTPETISVTTGGESFNIPTVLCKRKGVGQWFYGKEAQRYHDEDEGELLSGLVELARQGNPVTIEEAEYDSVALLTLFVKRSLTLVSMIAGLDKVAAFMFTCENLDQRLIEILTTVVAGLGIKTQKISFQSHAESFYYYALSQPNELWKHQVLLCDYSQENMKTYRLELNRRTTPTVAYIEKKEHRKILQEDSVFLGELKEAIGEHIITSVYLIGDGFKGDWMKESIRYLCNKGRIFQGNNLFSKGACYGAKEKLEATRLSQEYVFLGEDKLKANVGMKVLRRGIDSYFALLDAGQNWFDAVKDCEFILETGNEFELLITPLNGKEAKLIDISLEGLPGRPDKTTRIFMKIYLKNVSTVALEMEDRGFGDIFPASGLTWKEEFQV